MYDTWYVNKQNRVTLWMILTKYDCAISERFTTVKNMVVIFCRICYTCKHSDTMKQKLNPLQSRCDTTF